MRPFNPVSTRPAPGLALALGLWILPGLLSAQTGEADPAPSSDPAAVERIEAWIDALGGMEPYWNLSTARYTLTTEMYDDQSGRLRRTRPRYVTIARTEAGELARIERWEGDDFIAQGWDGEERWATLNGEALGPGDMDYDEVTYVASDVNYWIALPWKLTDPGVFLHDDGTDDEGRRVVRVTFGEDVGDHQDTWRYFFEEGRTWPVEIQYVEEGKTSVNRTRWEDIREVDGYIFVGRRVHFNEDGVTKVLFTHDMEINPEIDPSIFSTP
jgi:hypothetical protein